MKKILYVLICIFLMLSLSSCDIKRIVYANIVRPEVPTYYRPSKWVCQEPSIWFTVEENPEYVPNKSDLYIAKGEMVIDNQTFEILVKIDDVLFQMDIYTVIDGELRGAWSGDCSLCYEDEFCLLIQSDNSYKGEYDEIIFHRVE